MRIITFSKLRLFIDKLLSFQLLTPDLSEVNEAEKYSITLITSYSFNAFRMRATLTRAAYAHKGVRLGLFPSRSNPSHTNLLKLHT